MTLNSCYYSIFLPSAVQGSPKYRSSIYIAQRRTIQSVMHLFDRSCRRIDAHDQLVVNRRISRRRLVLQCQRPRDLRGFLGMKCLPDPEDFVDHRMVEEEGDIIG
jgi:hypothetical protein